MKDDIFTLIAWRIRHYCLDVQTRREERLAKQVSRDYVTKTFDKINFPTESLKPGYSRPVRIVLDSTIPYS